MHTNENIVPWEVLLLFTRLELVPINRSQSKQ